MAEPLQLGCKQTFCRLVSPRIVLPPTGYQDTAMGTPATGAIAVSRECNATVSYAVRQVRADYHNIGRWLSRPNNH